jgi:hypothetical protein
MGTDQYGIHVHVATGPTQLRKRLRESGELGLSLGISFVERHQHPDPPHTLDLLRVGCDRPRCHPT